MKLRRRTRGLTLLECMLFCALYAILAVATMRIVGDARVVRSNARDRTRLAVIAQSELDRLRSVPAAERKVGVQTMTNAAWPQGTQVQVELKPAGTGTWNVEVRATRASIEGKPSVRLASVIAGGQS